MPSSLPEDLPRAPAAVDASHLPPDWAEQLAPALGGYLRDRGLIQVGKKADLNVIDFDNLHLHAPYMTNDLPKGGKRLLQKADGYRATVVAGQVIAENAEMTAARPGITTTTINTR